MKVNLHALCTHLQHRLVDVPCHLNSHERDHGYLSDGDASHRFGGSREATRKEEEGSVLGLASNLFYSSCDTQ